MNVFRVLKTSGDTFKYSRKIDIDNPKNELLKVWFCNEMEKISSLFLKTDSFNIDDLMESHQLYVGPGFFSSIFRGTDIVIKGTKLSSKASATIVNQSRLLSSREPIQNMKMGRRGDTIFSRRDIELGCTEMGAAKDQTKGIRGSMLKIPICDIPKMDPNQQNDQQWMFTNSWGSVEQQEQLEQQFQGQQR
ncbi:hypothetical protein INT45_003824 [Circinella minor]|uniref:Uncharacterized protein n=1 Tax=Circinella minor TaxID=1195481 RepID=A0A8H7VU24_9FUNG|nr:hypothetical protein INT45_003824 [Circinella minor]